MLFQNDDCENESQVSLLLYFITLFLQMMIRHQKRVKLASSVTLLNGNFAVLIKYVKLFFRFNYSRSNNQLKTKPQMICHGTMRFYIFMSFYLITVNHKRYIWCHYHSCDLSFGISLVYHIHLDGISSQLWNRYSIQFIVIWSRLSLRCLKLETTKRNLLENNRQNWNLNRWIDWPYFAAR